MIAASRPRIAINERLLLLAMFGVISLSGIVFIEPAPYDIALLAVGTLALLFGLRIPAKFAPMLFCFTLIIIFGFVASLYSSQITEAALHIVTTAYLIVGTIILAAFIAAMPLRAISVVMNGYIVAALIATLAGFVGYFDLIPGAYDVFTLYGRLSGTFKDPNVYGPFLIAPLLFLIFQLTTQPGKHLPVQLAAAVILTAGIFLSFSRGAWGHLVVSGLVLLPMILVVLPNNRSRFRLLFFGLLALVSLGLFLLALLGSSSISEMFSQRAQLTQVYDAGGRGRFDGQRLALEWVLSSPLGSGWGEFSRYWGEQAHNVYISQFMFSGWIGGFAYIALIIMTLIRGFVFIRYNLAIRPYLMVFLATFCGLILQGLIIDMDHWRHFYLVIAAIWGLTSAPWAAQEVERNPGRSI